MIKIIKLTKNDYENILNYKETHSIRSALVMEKNYYLFYIAQKISKLNDPLITLRGSYIYLLTIDNYKRTPNDLDFSYNIDLLDQEKISLVRKIISSIDSKIILRRKKTSFSQFGYFPYESVVDDKIKLIKIECMIRSPIVPEVMSLDISKPLNESDWTSINVYSYEQLFIDKVFSLNYLGSKYYTGEKSRYYDALYDTWMLLNSEYYSIFMKNRNALVVNEKIRADLKIHNEMFSDSLNNLYLNNKKKSIKLRGLYNAKKYSKIKKLTNDIKISVFLKKYNEVRAKILSLIKQSI